MINLDRFRDVDLVIDKANDNFIEKKWVSTGDREGRTLTVMVTDGGVVGELPGASVSFLWTNKANGLTDETAFVIKDKATSKFVIQYPTHMLTPGTVIAQIRVWYNGKTITTKPFEITVSGIAGQMKGIVAQQEFGMLTATLADANLFRTDIDNKADTKWVKNNFATNKTQFTNTFTTLTALENAYPNGSPGLFLIYENNGLYEYISNKWTYVDKYELSEFEIKNESVTQKKLADGKVKFSNQLTNASLVSSASWGIDNGINTATRDGRLSTTAVNSADYVNIHQLQTITKDKQYFVQGSVSVDNTNIDTIYLIAGSKVLTSVKPAVSNGNYRVAAVIKDVDASFVQFRFVIKNKTIITTVSINKPMLIDITDVNRYKDMTVKMCQYILNTYFDGWVAGNNDLSKIALNEAIMLGDDGMAAKIQNLPIFNYEVFNKSYIRNKRMVTNLNQGSNDVKAFYNFIDVNEPVLKMSAKVSWTGKNTAALISQNNGMHNVSDITTSSIHILYQPDHVYIQMFVPGTGLVDLKAVDFPMLNLTGDVVYNIGWELVDDTITVTMPHGATISHTDARFKDVTGRYGCFEHFANVTNSGYGDTCYHEISINDTFYDDFARFDGSLGISPSGHIYSQISRV